MEDTMMGIVDDTDSGDRKRVRLGNRDVRLGGTDEFVAASWLRSQAAGVSPEGGDIRYIGDVDVASRLVHYAQPVLEKLIEYTEDVPLSVAVSDNKGRVLSRLDRLPPGRHPIRATARARISQFAEANNTLR
ncbi:hypothetical protein [Rhodococcus qingshengii]|uniref:hypothetical protein n=1 Tax=Rhodococcus qingshengii TaxID=334542 RepID=UPI001F48FAB2|nr:hypothetical protein [Rhodococcus qingshengii]